MQTVKSKLKYRAALTIYLK